jgi:hypothetical protein
MPPIPRFTRLPNSSIVFVWNVANDVHLFRALNAVVDVT